MHRHELGKADRGNTGVRADATHDTSLLQRGVGHGTRTVACAAGQATARPAPSARGRTGSTWPASVMWRTHAASASGDSRTASRRRSHEPSGGAPCAQRRGSRGARSARVGRVVRRICRSASAERALPPGRPRAGRSSRRVRSTRAPTGRELARGKWGATWTTSEQFSNGRNGGTCFL